MHDVSFHSPKYAVLIGRTLEATKNMACLLDVISYERKLVTV